MEDAEDVVQEGFVKTFNKLYTFNYESTFGSWLKRIIIKNIQCFFIKSMCFSVKGIDTKNIFYKGF